MASRIRYLWQNLIDLTGTNLTASSEVSTLPVANLRHPFRTLVWRTTGCAEEYVVVDFGSPYSVKAVSFINHNLTSNAVIKLQANSSDSWDNPPFETTLTPHKETIIKCFDAQNYRYWRLWIQDSGNPSGYIEIGRLYLGSYFEPSRNFVYGWEYRIIDPSRIDASEGGQEFADIEDNYRVIYVAFGAGMITEEDKEEYERMLAYCGRSRDLFIALDYENHPNDWTFYGKFVNTDFSFKNSVGEFYEAGFEFKESR
ncbi:MAG: hypothetical protein J7L64_02665 [Acidobacteria bacterium]|nr:hypothetical protein [Acidobacteriota bacterium]